MNGLQDLKSIAGILARRSARIVLLLCLFAIGTALAQKEPQSSEYRFVFLPSGLNFAPLRGNTQEARIGVFKFLDNSNMKVDIGNSIDLFGYRRGDSGIVLTAGIDFEGFALTTGAQGLRLQIDALDGFFGGNLAIGMADSGGWWKARLRLLHHSAHLVDGAYNRTLGAWNNNRIPVPFTRDFGELVFAREGRSSDHETNFRLYAGLSYATLVRPNGIMRIEYLAGGEVYRRLNEQGLWGHPVNAFVCGNSWLMSADSYDATNQVQAGFKFGEWNGKGPAIYLGYYNGRMMFAEYYDLHITTVGAGFTVDF